ncbi:MAG: EAL domain-containing protein [Phycisphaerales bacterium]|nr:EAL domain-containing protein [Phycisphaerae bacterium]NNF42386.1 EAL domain-containing protein [Phycisphaerales bacterium]NNM26334.1 EAL domain-containing protein [Phycisphaerales bacterium]
MSIIDIIRDVILVAAAVLVLIVLRRVGTEKRRVPVGVWPFLVTGFSLLLMGRVLETLTPEALHLSVLVKAVLQEIFGFVLGFVTLSTGLIRWLPDLLPSREPAEQQPSTPAPAPIEANLPSEHSSQELLASILKSSLAGVLVLRAVRDDIGDVVDFECKLMNATAEQILGRPASSFVGCCVLRELPCLKAEISLAEAVSVIDTGLPFKSERHFTQGGNGAWYQFVAVKLGDGLAVTFADISARKRAEAQLRHAAHHDTLTGLPNRALFMERLQQAINRAKRFPEYEFAVLFLDFDRFKIINDSLGHDAGDQLLTGIADRLRGNLRSLDLPSRVGDGHLPARLGGDEFVILLDSINGVRDAVRVAERLQIELSAPHTIDGHEVISTASIGIVTSNLGYETPDDIIRDADTAMYRAKTSGKARHVVFDQKMHEEVVDRLDLEQQLREAVEQCAFTLEFEPIVDLHDGGLAGFEALIRWPHPTRGLLQPSEFVPLAEEIGLMVPIGAWVISEACRQLKEWHTAYPTQTNLAISVNLARQQMLHPDLIPTIERVLAETGVPAERLRLEMVEDMLMDDQKAAQTVLGQLRTLGVKLVMDDFGTGHSSLSSLHRFPIDILKIDRDFIGSVKKRRDYGAIVHAVVELAHNLDMQVVAEGVETEDQLALLQALDCDYAQGQRFSLAVPADEVKRFLETEHCFRHAA